MADKVTLTQQHVASHRLQSIT